MTYVAPTVSDTKTRFPEFASIDDALVQLILDEAISEVGTLWIEDDRRPAQMYLAAHMIASEGGAARSGGGTMVSGAIKRVKVGEEETEYADGSSSSSGGGLASGSGFEGTIYGQRYVRLRARSFPGVYFITADAV